MLYLTGFGQNAGDRRRMEHEAGEALLAFALREEYGISCLPRISRGEHGKPYFPDHSGIYFNISHSAGMAVCAVAGSELGVDLEHVRRVGKRLPERVLSAREREWLAGQPDREEAFIRLWTLKESYVKATGDGISADLPTVEFLLPDSGLDGKIRCSRKGFGFYQQKLGRGIYLAVCSKGDSLPESVKKLHIIF